MEREQIDKLCQASSDRNYHTFLHDRGWAYRNEDEAKAAYARYAKALRGELLTQAEFIMEARTSASDIRCQQLYSNLLALVEKGVMPPGQVYQYARHRWCITRPEAVVAHEIGPKRWAINTCSQEISVEQAVLLINSTWGFEASQIHIIGTPYYDATDWNFIQFQCRRVDWVMHDGMLDQICQ